MDVIRRFKKGDIILVLMVAIMVLVPLAWSYMGVAKPSDKLMAVIIRDGERVAEIDLNKVEGPQYFNYDDKGNHKVSIVAEKGVIKFVDSDCPDKICIKTGTLTMPGDKAVCLPNKTIVMIEEVD